MKFKHLKVAKLDKEYARIPTIYSILVALVLGVLHGISRKLFSTEICFHKDISCKLDHLIEY